MDKIKKKNIRVIARLDIKGNKLVKGVQLEGLRTLGMPSSFIRYYINDMADELIFINVVASLYGRDQLFNVIGDASEGNFLPLAVGGGLRKIDDIFKALEHGADRVAINSRALNQPSFLDEAVKIFGSSTIQLSIQARKDQDNNWFAFSDAGRNNKKTKVTDWIKEAQDRGVGEILVTDISRDGTAKGFNIDLFQQISDVCTVPLIASGGCGVIEDCIKVAPYVDAICVGTIIHYNKDIQLETEAADVSPFSFSPRNTLTYSNRLQPTTIYHIKKSLSEAGYQVRL